jgi:hypothetical protein
MSVTFNSDDFSAPVVKRIAGTVTGTTALTIWTPATGKKIRVHGIWVQGRVTTILAAATINDPIWLAETSIATPLIQIGRIVSATDAVGTAYGFFTLNIDAGFTLSAASAPLVINTAAGITTGVITFNGFVSGAEV